MVPRGGFGFLRRAASPSPFTRQEVWAGGKYFLNGSSTLVRLGADCSSSRTPSPRLFGPGLNRATNYIRRACTHYTYNSFYLVKKLSRFTLSLNLFTGCVRLGPSDAGSGWTGSEKWTHVTRPRLGWFHTLFFPLLRKTF